MSKRTGSKLEKCERGEIESPGPSKSHHRWYIEALGVDSLVFLVKNDPKDRGSLCCLHLSSCLSSQIVMFIQHVGELFPQAEM